MMSEYQQSLLLRLVRDKTVAVQVRYGWRGRVSAIYNFDRVPMRGERIEIDGQKYMVKKVTWTASLENKGFMASVLLK